MIVCGCGGLCFVFVVCDWVWLIIACCDGLNMMGDAVLACECVVVYCVCDCVSL